MSDTQNKKAIFLMGLPASGKSRLRANNYSQYPVVDCDEIKKQHPNYDPKNPGLVHAWSQIECSKVFNKALKNNSSFVYDSTGTNVEKMASLMIKAKTAGFTIVLAYMQCDLETCITRNANRERTVPIEILIEKSKTITIAFEILCGYADRVRIYNSNK